MADPAPPDPSPASPSSPSPTMQDLQAALRPWLDRLVEVAPGGLAGAVAGVAILLSTLLVVTGEVEEVAASA